jgi:hypothetical protein
MTLSRKLALLVIGVPTLAVAGDFHRLVSEFSRQTGVHQTHIPFLGLARFIVATAHPAGTSEFRMAVFENVHGRQRDFVTTADGLVREKGWNRIVRVRSNKGESTNIYMQPEGQKLRMLVTAIDDGDAVFIEMRIKPEQLEAFVDKHRHQHH